MYHRYFKFSNRFREKDSGGPYPDGYRRGLHSPRACDHKYPRESHLFDLCLLFKMALGGFARSQSFFVFDNFTLLHFCDVWISDVATSPIGTGQERKTRKTLPIHASREVQNRGTTKTSQQMSKKGSCVCALQHRTERGLPESRSSGLARSNGRDPTLALAFCYAGDAIDLTPPKQPDQRCQPHSKNDLSAGSLHLNNRLGQRGEARYGWHRVGPNAG